MSLFHTHDGSDDRFQVSFFTEEVVSIRDGRHFDDDRVLSRVSLINRAVEIIPESEGRRLRDVLELEQATEGQVDLYLDHEQIAQLTEASETNPKATRFRITVPVLSDVPPAAQIDL